MDGNNWRPAQGEFNSNMNHTLNATINPNSMNPSTMNPNSLNTNMNPNNINPNDITNNMNPSMNPNMNPNTMNPGNKNPNNLNPNLNPNMNPNMDASDWRTQLLPDSRQRIVNKIMDTLKKHLPIYGPDGLVELKKIAVRFEEKIYTAATSQTDYLRKISLKMLTMENKSQPTGVGNNSLPSAATGGNQNPQLSGSHGMQAQVRNQTQQHVGIPMGNQSQSRQQMIQQNLQNTIPSAAVQNSTSLPPSVAPMTGVAQTSMSNVVGQSSSLPPNMTSISQNSVNNGIVGPGVSPSMFTNSQRQQLAGRQQGLSHQPGQNVTQQFNMYQQQIMKQRVQQQVQPSLLQSQLQQQQQSLLQSNQMQGSQQSLMQMSSGLPTNQASLQQTQSSMMQSNAQSGLQQNPPIQQTPAVLQQHTQSIMRHQQQSQQSSLHQQQLMSSQQQQQQQQQLGQQPSGSSMQQNQLLTQQQQNSFSDMQQQRLLGQHQQQLIAQQGNITNLHQQMSSQNNVTNMQQHQHPMRLQQAKVAALQQQQQNQQTSSTLLPSQGQQTQMQPPQQQLISHLQSQQTQLPQQLGLQQQQQQQQELQQSNALQQDMQQRTQASSASLQPQITVDQQRQQLFQSQRGISEAPSTSMDSTAQTGQNGTDWQEEIYQKIKSLKDMHYLDLLEIYNRISQKFQQADSLQGSKPGDQMDKLRYLKAMVEKMLQFLTIQKGNIQQAYKEKMPLYEKQILNFLNTHRQKKPSSTQQQPGGQSGAQSQTISQQSAPQISQAQQHDNHMNQMQPINLQGSGTSGVQHGGSMSSSTHLGVSQTQQNMMNSLQNPPNMDMVQGSPLSQGVIGTVSPNIVNGSQQSNLSTFPQGGGVNMLQPNMNTLQTNANLLQQQHLKPQQDQQQLAQAQQLKQQFQQRHMHPLMQKQQLILQQQQIQQQQLHQQQKQQTSQIHQMNSDVNDLKVRQGAGMIKPGMFGQHHQGSRPTYPHQQLKPGAPFPISSAQLLQSPSPQISQHPSPQIDHQLLNSLPKTGTPLQNASSPFIVPSPSTPLLAPSPIPNEMEKPQTSSVSAISSYTGNAGTQQMTSSITQAQSLAIGTPGISASPLLAEFSIADGNLGNGPAVLPGKPNIAERPLDQLIKVVRSMSPEAFRSCVSDIGSVVSMVDRIAGSAPGNGSRAAVGEDLVAMTKCRLQARNLIPTDGNAGATKKMRRHTSAMPLNAVSSAGSVNNDGLWQLSSLGTSELESTATSKIKRQKVEANHALLNEIREINLRLIDTVVEMSDEDMDSISAAAEGEGSVVRCSFSAVALSPSLKSHLVSTQMSPVLPLRLLVPVNYPNCSPVLLDKLPDEPGKEMEDLSTKARSRFSICLRGLSQPMSLSEMARTWDDCARKVISEYAQRNGGGSFSSSYGTWESCVSV